MEQLKIGFIGAGNMNGAIIGGLVNSAYPTKNIMVSNPSEGKLNNLKKQYSVLTTQDNTTVASFAEVLILGVKPYNIEAICKEIAPHISKPLIISVAAGKTIASIEALLGAQQAVIRVMPNTPSLISKGAAGLFANQNTKAHQKSFAAQLFQAVGITEWLDTEDKIDLVTALSGSGPAYFFYLAEAMIASAVEQGMDKNQATNLVTQTALGAAAMLDQDGADAEALRIAVTSPNGTTEAALNELNSNQVNQSIKSAVLAAYNRGQQLAKDD